MNPEMMLFDEPTSALDPELVKGILEVNRAVRDAETTLLVGFVVGEQKAVGVFVVQGHPTERLVLDRR